MIDLVSTALGISTRLDNKPTHKYGLFDKFSLSVIGACEVANNTDIFLTRSNQYIQEINIHFDGTLNNYSPVDFVENQEQN